MRRPRCRFEAAHGHSVGEAEHRPHTALSRTRVLAVAFVVALVGVPTTAAAQSTQDQIETTRASIDKLAADWFAHQVEADRLAAQIDELEQLVAAADDRAKEAAAVAQDHAVEIYKGS